MNNAVAINVNNPIEIRTNGIHALEEALGPIGMTRFMQQFEPGSGDYTKEKYEQGDLSIDEVVAQIKNSKK